MSNTLQFELRVARSEMSFTPEKGFCSTVEYRVECRSHREAFVTPYAFRTARFGRGEHGVPQSFTDIGWMEAGGEGRYEYELALPISSHEFLELSQGMLSYYWSREELVRAFEYANAHMTD